MPKLATILPLVLVGIVLAQAAPAMNTPSGTRVRESGSEIEVFGTSAGSIAFCAAGQFARHRMGARGADRLVLTRPRGPSPTQPGQLSVGFTLAGPEAQTRFGGGIVMVTGRRGVGMNRSVSHAIALCQE